MDKEILIQYTYMKAEVKDLHRRIEKLTEEINNISEVTDYVSCGKKHWRRKSCWSLLELSRSILMKWTICRTGYFRHYCRSDHKGNKR